MQRDLVGGDFKLPGSRRQQQLSKELNSSQITLLHQCLQMGCVAASPGVDTWHLAVRWHAVRLISDAAGSRPLHRRHGLPKLQQ